MCLQSTTYNKYKFHVNSHVCRLTIFNTLNLASFFAKLFFPTSHVSLRSSLKGNWKGKLGRTLFLWVTFSCAHWNFFFVFHMHPKQQHYHHNTATVLSCWFKLWTVEIKHITHSFYFFTTKKNWQSPFWNMKLGLLIHVLAT